MKKLTLFFTFLILSNSFGKITPIGKKKFKPRAANKPVRIVYQNKSDFDFIYEEICHISLKGKKKALTKYHKAIKKEARKCGANGVVITSARAKKTKVKIKAVGIRIYSEKKKLGDTLYNQIILAINKDRPETIKVLLEKINRKRSKRAPSDSLKLDNLFFLAADKGLSCNPKTLQIFSEHESILAKFDLNKREYVPGIPSENLIYCGNSLNIYFPSTKDKARFVFDLNKYYDSFLLKSSELSTKEADMFSIMIDRYYSLFDLVYGTILDSCASKRTRLCALKSKVKKNLNSTKKMRKSL